MPKFLKSMRARIIAALCVILLCTFGILNVASFVSAHILSSAYDMGDMQAFLEQPELKEEEYKDVDTKSLGMRGYFEVLDLTGKVLYTSGNKAVDTYSSEALSFLPESVEGVSFYLQELNTEKGRYYVITEYDGSYEVLGITIVDDENVVEYSTISSILVLDEIRKEELDLLRDEMVTGAYLSKYEFCTDSGEKRILLIHTYDMGNGDWLMIMNRANLASAVTACALLLVLIYIGGSLMHRDVLRPLLSLQETMIRFSSGENSARMKYKGILELENISNAFNGMADELVRNEEEKHKMEEDRQRILRDVSHDLRTPVTVLQGYVSALKDGMIPESDLQTVYDIMNRKTELITQLLGSFLEYSTIENPQFTLNEKTEDMAEFMRRYFADKYEELMLENCTLSVDIPDEQVEMKFDVFQMKRVFENLLSNTIKHNPNGCSINVALNRCAGNVVITYMDDGSGIPSEIRDTLFEPFVTGDAARTSGKGSGLGASIVRSILHAHGGQIRLLDVQKGAAFEIVMPIR